MFQAPRWSKLYYPAVPKVRARQKFQTEKNTCVFGKYMLGNGECHANRFVKLKRHRQAIASEDAAFLQSIVVDWYPTVGFLFHSLLPISTSKTRTRGDTRIRLAPLSTFRDKLCSNRQRCVAQRPMITVKRSLWSYGNGFSMVRDIFSQTTASLMLSHCSHEGDGGLSHA